MQIGEQNSIPITAEELEQYPGVDYCPPAESQEPKEKLDFMKILPRALTMIKRLDREDLEEAIRLLKEHYKSQAPLPYTTEGPCLFCSKHMSYLPLTKAHIRFGEEWFRKVARDAKEIGIYLHGKDNFDSGGLMVGGRQFHFVKRYLCLPCIEILKNKHRPLQHLAYKQRVELEKQWEDRRNSEVAERESLRWMPYKEFLQTDHWKYVRGRAMKRAGYRCELCSTQDRKLHVHHKTYEHRGSEDRYPGDLIVLCEICHGKFHDKVATPPKEPDV